MTSATARAAERIGHWIGGGIGNWSDPARWDIGVVPDNNATDTFVAFVDGGNNGAASVATVDTDITIDGLAIDPDDTVRIADGTTLQIVGGLLDLGSGAVRNRLHIGNGGTLAFTGDLTASGHAAIITGTGARIGGGNHFTFGLGNSFHGTGNIGLDQSRLTNHSDLVAMGGQLRLQPNSQGMVSDTSVQSIGPDSILTFSAGSAAPTARTFHLDGLVRAFDRALLEFEPGVTVTGSASWQLPGGRVLVHTGAAVNGTGPIHIHLGGELRLEQDARMSGSDFTTGVDHNLNVSGTLSLAGRFAFTGNQESRLELGGLIGTGDDRRRRRARGDPHQISTWSGWRSLEVGGLDQGDVPVGFADNFDLQTLVIGPGARIYLRDVVDNGNRSSPEALYVDNLVFADAAGILNLNGIHLYYNTLTGDPSQVIDVIVPEPGLGGVAIGLLPCALAARRRPRRPE